MRATWTGILCWLMLLTGANAAAQNVYQDRQFQFLSFEAIPTWTGVATDWDKADATLHLYDSERYKGHAQYISVALKTGITFAQFKAQVKTPSVRKYMPFFLFDLRQKPPLIGDKKYDWALRIEDYSYQDDAASMTATTLRLLRTVTAYIQTASGRATHGIVILATNLQSQPNVNIAPALNQAGYPNMTVNQLLTRMGGKAAHVLNAGTGYGYLRYVPAGDEADFKASAQDIVVYARMPARVPPVNGIITLEPQTPLSHVNLLAKNRGTFNLYALDMDAIPGLKNHIGKLVKMDCTPSKITLHEAKEADAKAFWDKRHAQINIPAPDTSFADIVPLAATHHARQGPTTIGAKAANYAVLQQHYPQYVRPGLAIPFQRYTRTLRASGADHLIDSLLTYKAQCTAAQIDDCLSRIQQKIMAAPLDSAAVKPYLNLLHSTFPDKRLRLRSSTNCEDLPGFNGAGLYLSVALKAKDGPAVFEKLLLQIYASLWTSTAFAEREYYGIDHRKAAMAILVNEAYKDEYANGVILTIPDKNGYAIAINTQFGDSAVTNPESGQVPEALLFRNNAADTYTVETKSNIHDIFLQPDWKPLLLELKQLTQKIHADFTARYAQDAHTAYGVDIEFKVVQDGNQFKLYIKQARPLGQVLPE